jgi:hypothetical protein
MLACPVVGGGGKRFFPGWCATEPGTGRRAT